MNRTLAILLSLCASFAVSSQIKQHKVGSLTIEVYLPPKYSEDGSYPVVYSNDGEWLFGSQSWRLNENLDDWIKAKKIDPIILVAILSDGSRESKYIPYQDPSISNYNTDSETYTNQIINEVIPFVEKTYATSKNRAIMGASFGGLHSTWAGIKNPETFHFVIAQSPSYWVADFKIHDMEVISTDQTIWIDIGTRDWDDVLSMYYYLSQKGFQPCENLFYFEDYGGMHIGSSWKARLLYPLILFTKGSSETIALNMQTEYIPSAQRRGHFFSRVNPVVTLKNGIKHTPFPFTFNSKNGKTQVSPYGSFKIESGSSDFVSGTYQGKSDDVKIKWVDNPMNE